MNKLRNFIYFVGLLLIGLVPQTMWAGPPQKLTPNELGEFLEKAETPEDHLKLVEYYSAEAERFEKDAERHEETGARYRRRKNLPPKIAPLYQDMAKHCASLAQSLRNDANLAREMAESHKKMAGELKK